MVKKIWKCYFCDTFLSTCEEYSQLEDVMIITYIMVTMPLNGAATSKSDHTLLKNWYNLYKVNEAKRSHT